MNLLRATQNVSCPIEKMPNTDPAQTTRSPGTRDACPTTVLATDPRILWGSRLGCREGGQHGQLARCRPADNPFASHRIEALPYRDDRLVTEEAESRIRNLGGRVAIIGPHGSGKTTLLENLASLLPGDAVQVRIPGSCPRPWRTTRAQLPRPVHAHHTILVDGAEQLGPLGWRLLLRRTHRARYLIVTLHRAGLLPTLIECRTDRDLLGDLVEELVPSDASFLAPGLDDLFERHRGNIRSCLRELFDLYAGRAAPLSST